MQGRPKGGKNKYYSKEEKIKIVQEMLNGKTPTDNPIIESKNGWLKKEMYIDFNQDDYDTVEDYINAIIYDHNYLRPSYTLNYKTPIEYRTQLGFK